MKPKKITRRELCATVAGLSRKVRELEEDVESMGAALLIALLIAVAVAAFGGGVWVGQWL